MTEPLNHRFFEVGTKWRHKRQPIIYHVHAKGQDEDGKLVISLALFDPHHARPDPFPMHMTWTPEEVLREFDPVDPNLTKWDRLMMDND